MSSHGIVTAIKLILNAVAFFSGLAGAYFWYRSATVKYPNKLVGITPIGAPTMTNTAPLMEAFNKSADMNKWAAGFSAGSLLASAIANCLPS